MYYMNLSYFLIFVMSELCVDQGQEQKPELSKLYSRPVSRLATTEMCLLMLSSYCQIQVKCFKTCFEAERRYLTHIKVIKINGFWKSDFLTTQSTVGELSHFKVSQNVAL